MDIIDLASQREQADRELALANQQAKRSTRPPASHCLACGEPILSRGSRQCLACSDVLSAKRRMSTGVKDEFHRFEFWV